MRMAMTTMFRIHRHLVITSAADPNKTFYTVSFPASAFPNPPLGQEGNLGRNTYDQPGYGNVNLNVAKLIFAPWFHGEKLNIEVRGEIFDLFNKANLINVDSELTDSEFGRATSQLPAREVQFHVRAQF